MMTLAKVIREVNLRHDKWIESQGDWKMWRIVRKFSHEVMAK